MPYVKLPAELTLSWKPDVTAQEIVVVLSRDPMLASQLLKLSQSPLYRGAQVRSLHDAVVRLGLRRVSDLFCRAAMHICGLGCNSRHVVTAANVATIYIVRLQIAATGAF